jgi:hypothetical protein
LWIRDLEHTQIPIVIPKGYSEATVNFTPSHQEKIWSQRHNVSPPERVNKFPLMRRPAIAVEFGPSQIDQRQIMPVVEFVKKHHQDSRIMFSQINNYKHPILFTSASKFPMAFGLQPPEA